VPIGHIEMADVMTALVWLTFFERLSMPSWSTRCQAASPRQQHAKRCAILTSWQTSRPGTLVEAIYLPSISSFFFSSAFISFTTGVWSLEPVVCVLVAGGALFGSDFSFGCSRAGRVAVDLGGEVSSANASPIWRHKNGKTARTGPMRFMVHLF
jgi:hypothetical protein